MANLTHLEIEGFRGYKKSYDFRSLNLILGPIGSHKSTSLDAIMTAVLGVNRLTDAKGAGLENDITYGTEQWWLTLKGTAGGHYFNIDRRKKANKHDIVFQNGSADISSLTEAKGAIQSMFGLSSEVLGALFDPSLIVEKKPEEQAVVMRKLLRGQGEIPIPESVKKLGYRDIDSVAALDNLIKDLTERRKLANKAASTGVGKIPDQVDVGAIDYDAEIGKFQKQREEINVKRAGITERLRAATEAKNRVAPEFDEARFNALVADASARKQAIDKGRESLADKDKAYREIDRGPLATVLESQRASCSTAQGRLDAANSSLEAFKVLGNTCSLCHQKITQAKYKQVIGDLQKAIEDRQAELAHWSGEVQETLRRLEEVKLAALAEVRSLDATLKALTEEHQESRPELEKLQRQQDALKAFESECKVTVDTAALHQELTALGRQQEIICSESVDLAAKQIEWRDKVAQNKMRDELLRRSDSLQRERSQVEGALEDLIAVRKNLLSSGNVDSFISGINQFAGPLGLQPVTYNGTLLCGGHPPARQSSGQRMLLELGFRISAAKSTGLGILVMDDINRMGELLRGLVIDKILGSGVQAILASTTDRADKLVIPKELEEKIAVYRL